MAIIAHQINVPMCEHPECQEIAEFNIYDGEFKVFSFCEFHKNRFMQDVE